MNQLSLMPDWNPRRSGSIYCSPACGAECSWSDFQKAHVAAKKLAAQLGAGWKPIVYENMDWHYKVKKGNCEVYPRNAHDKHIVYIADLRVPGDQFLDSDPDPRQAVAHVIVTAKDVIHAIQLELKKLKA